MKVIDLVTTQGLQVVSPINDWNSLEDWEVWVNIVAADVQVLKHQAITSHNVDPLLSTSTKWYRYLWWRNTENLN